jgi:hypothetical protein
MSFKREEMQKGLRRGRCARKNRGNKISLDEGREGGGEFWDGWV